MEDLVSAGHPAPRRRLLGSIAIVALGVVALLLLLVLVLEIGSRIADGIVARRAADANRDPQRKPDLIDSIALTAIDPAVQKFENARTIPHPYLSFALKPAWSTPPGAAQQCSHNSLGFRGKETTVEKPSGVFRIVTMGGSSVYGQSESRDEAVWSARLEEILAERRPPPGDGAGGGTNGGPRIEVINGGVSGYTSYEMLIELELMVLDLDPDLIVLYETVNDMRSALYTHASMVPKGDNTHWRATWPVDRPSPIEKALEKSRAYLIWRRYMTDYAQRRADLAYYTLVGYDGRQGVRLYCGAERGYPGGVVPEEGVRFYRRNLENMITLAQKAGVKVVIATQALMRWDKFTGPDPTELRECGTTQLEVFARIQDVQREVARERGEHLAETGRVIEAEEDRIFRETGRHCFKNDVHPFDDGSELIARAVADALVASGLLP